MYAGMFCYTSKQEKTKTLLFSFRSPQVKGLNGFKQDLLDENPITTYGVNSKCPVTMMGTAGLIKDNLLKAITLLKMIAFNKELRDLET